MEFNSIGEGVLDNMLPTLDTKIGGIQWEHALAGAMNVGTAANLISTALAYLRCVADINRVLCH